MVIISDGGDDDVDEPEQCCNVAELRMQPVIQQRVCFCNSQFHTYDLPCIDHHDHSHLHPLRMGCWQYNYQSCLIVKEIILFQEIQITYSMFEQKFTYKLLQYHLLNNTNYCHPKSTIPPTQRADLGNISMTLI